jgi:hypothetical protein
MSVQARKFLKRWGNLIDRRSGELITLSYTFFELSCFCLVPIVIKNTCDIHFKS